MRTTVLLQGDGQRRARRRIALFAALGAVVLVAMVFGFRSAVAWAKELETKKLQNEGLLPPEQDPEKPAEPVDPMAPPPHLPISPLAMDGRALVLMYHDVLPDRNRENVWFDTTTDELISQIEYIEERGGQFISMDRLYTHLTTGAPIPDRAVVMTFDDSYLSFKTLVMPILKERGIPATVFTHTAYVGVREGRPKMSWDELKQVTADPLFTVGSHTVTHPEKLHELTRAEQERELQDSKADLEKNLGTRIDYLCYPVGNQNELTRTLAQNAGYRMAFTMKSLLAEESPDILAVGRFNPVKLERGWERMEEAMALKDSALIVTEKPLTVTPFRSELEQFGRVTMAMLRGGRPRSLLSNARLGVSEFVEMVDADGGINGSFFRNAALRGNDNFMVGPVKASNRELFIPDAHPADLVRVANRPFVAWDDERIIFAPFQPGLNEEASLKELLPNATDCFVGGSWLVQRGVPLTREQTRPFAPSDSEDPRRRIFVGITRNGEMIAGASKNSISSEKLAELAAEAGAYTAVLLDSGFSTSVVYKGEILASGHSTPDIPSRPVPHAIVFVDENPARGSATAERESDPVAGAPIPGE